ncbi:MAG: DUF3303 domain-containing protein [Gemmatimonadaceae bacterium]
MVVETFREGDARPVYRRFRERGRLAPEGLRYVASWVSQAERRFATQPQATNAGDGRLLLISG